jgi:hypothetical protein
VFVSLSGVYELRPAVTFPITAVCQLRPRLLRVRVLVASRGQLSDIKIVYQATGDEPNGFSVEDGPGYLASMYVCGAARWVKLSDSWPKFKIADFQRMLLHIT